MAPRLIDLTGKAFGRWSVLYRASAPSAKVTRWLCRCECGTEKKVGSYHLLKGLSRSCGCARKENRNRLTHGNSAEGKRTPEYISWDGMTQRCTNPNNTSYPDYGGRGITICNDWLNGRGTLSPFEAFLEDMGKRPTRNHSIDRVDNSSCYSRENCRWATIAEQSYNKRNTVILTINGEALTVEAASEQFGIPAKTIHQRRWKGKTGLDLIKPVRHSHYETLQVVNDASDGSGAVNSI